MHQVHTRQHRTVYRAALVGAILLGVAPLVSGCQDQARTSHDAPPPVAQVARAKPEQPEEVHQVDMTILNGKLSADSYDVQTGPARLHITAQGGPYSVSVGTLAPAGVKVPAGGTADLAFTAADPGDYTVSVQSGQGAATEDTAVLHVHKPGF